MVAGSLIAQCAVDHDEIRRLAGRRDLTRRCDADQQAAATGEQFFGDQNRKRRPDGASDNAGLLFAERKPIELGMIAGPIFGALRLPGRLQAADDIAVGVEDADGRHVCDCQPLLTPCLAQQGRSDEHRRHGRVLVVEQRRRHGGLRRRVVERSHRSDKAALRQPTWILARLLPPSLRFLPATAAVPCWARAAHPTRPFPRVGACAS
jgi:hypothetical protein